MYKEWDVNTSHIPMPYLGFSVAGIEFGVTAYGGLGIGVEMEIEFAALGFSATGNIKRGIEYDAENNLQNYISDQDFVYSKTGPQIEFESMNITLYLKPTLYLALEYIGDIFFGLQTSIEFTFSKNVDYDDSADFADCAIDYVPSTKLLSFVGARLQPLGLTDILDKNASIESAHSILYDLQGCITQSTLTKLETYLHPSSRRRLGDHGNINDTVVDTVTFNGKHAMLDYTNSHLLHMDRYYGWGSRNSRWYGNMTRLPSKCPSGRVLVDGMGYEHPVYIPEEGSLVIRVEDDKNGESLTALLHTNVELFADDWGITTNVTCLSRMQLLKV